MPLRSPAEIFESFLSKSRGAPGLRGMLPKRVIPPGHPPAPPRDAAIFKCSVWPGCPSSLGGTGSTRKLLGWFAAPVLGCFSLFGLAAQVTLSPGLSYIFHRCISLPQSFSEDLLFLRCPLLQSFTQALSHSAAELPEDLLLYVSSPWNSPKIRVSHDHTQIPHQAAFLTCLEMLLFSPAAIKRQIGINFRSSYLKYPILLSKADSVQATHTPWRCLNCWSTSWP